MINSIRNTVLSIIDKDNSGYISPSEFNLFAKAAQLEIYQEYFDNYRKAIANKNNRKGSRGAADEVKDISHKLDIFTKKSDLAVGANYTFTLPSDMYILNTVTVTTDSVDDIVEEVDKTEFFYLKQANLASPSEKYRIYTRYGNEIDMFPVPTSAQAIYYGTPKTPKWTYLSTPGGDPIYNPSASDFQDFELHPEEETQLIVKILRYAGVTIRAEDVVSVAEGQDNKEYEKENLT
jgi:hypothetical protein